MGFMCDLYGIYVGFMLDLYGIYVGFMWDLCGIYMGWGYGGLMMTNGLGIYGGLIMVDDGE